jgi:hypothetical protein
MKTSALSANRIMHLGHSFKQAKALLSAVELGVFTALAEDPADLNTLRTRLGIHQRGAHDFLDALVALDLLDRDGDGRYANRPDADLYLVRGKPTYLGGLLDHLNAREYPSWNSLTPALQTGVASVRASGTGLYTDLYAEPKSAESFAMAMSGASLLVANALATKFPWQDHQTLIDVGAAEGCVSVQIARTYDHITGGGFDLPAVEPVFNRYVAKHELSNRLQFYPGDFLMDPLPPGDVLVLGRVLHNWDLATKKMLLDKAYKALATAGAVIVYEKLIDDDRRTSSVGLLASLNMLVMTEGGFDYSAAECIGWMGEVGFREMRVEALTDDQSMIVGWK